MKKITDYSCKYNNLHLLAIAISPQNVLKGYGYKSTASTL